MPSSSSPALPRLPRLFDAPRWDRILLAVTIGIVLFCTYRNGIRREHELFRMFLDAASRLVAGEDIYALDPVNGDRFKYSPTAAFFILPFERLPFALALLLWNALGALPLFWALRKLLPAPHARLVWALVLLEVMRSMQHSQVNGHVTALVILAFLALENARPGLSALWVAAGTALKVFPLAGVTFAVARPGRRRFAVGLAVSLVVLALLPLLVTSPERLLEQYRSWGSLLVSDAHELEAAPDLPLGPGLYGGIMNQPRIWFGWNVPNLPVQAAGTLLLLLPLLLGRRAYGDVRFRRSYLASVLVFLVVFNHQSESPSFVIAVTGIAIWYVTWPLGPGRTALMAITVAVVSLAAQDFVPAEIQRAVFNRFRLKTVPCAIAWVWIQVDLWRLALASPVPAPIALPRLPRVPV